MRNMRKSILVLSVILLATVVFPLFSVLAEEDYNVTYYRAKVTEVLEREDRVTEYSGGAFEENFQIVNALILKGPYKGLTVTAEYALNYGLSDQHKADLLRKNDHVMLYLETDPGGEIQAVYVAEIARDRHLLALLLAFFLFLVIVGGMKGFKAIISLILTVFAILFILIPSILNGRDPVLLSAVICIFIIGLTLLIISGFNKKTLSAVIGTAGGVLIAGLIAVLVGNMAKISGFSADESQMLLYIPQDIVIDFRGLLFAAILIGSMGATMDIGMTVASSMHEVKVNRPDILPLDLFKAGMNVGRDAMATMTNTLILAYTGGSLQLMILLMAYRTPFNNIINWDVIASEILKGLAGSIGIIFTVPITALAAGLIENHMARKREGR
ncbi:MAG: YibE/F family protein [Clostridia bacterium]